MAARAIAGSFMPNKESDVMRHPSIFRHSLISTIAGLASLAGLAAMSASATAEPVIRMEVDSVRLVKLVSEPSTVVLSNPIYADATVQGDRLVLIGKNTGRTNVIVLDIDGNQIANFMIMVQRDENKYVSVYRAGQRRTMQCEPFCDDVLTVNDEANSFNNMAQQIATKAGASADGGSGAPAAQ
jgi:Flp pilus assembly secretin CpaC